MKSFYNVSQSGKQNAFLLKDDNNYENAHEILMNLPSPASATTGDTISPTSIDLNQFDKNLLKKRTGLIINDSSGYDTLKRPFKHDPKRGRWSCTSDFFFACTSHAFGVNTFSEQPVYALVMIRGIFLPIYLIAIVLYTLPIFMLQAFLGQFSSSGAISAFRVAPLFKGLGYAILLFNLAVLGYCAILAAVPLLYAISSFHSVLPWMTCDNVWNTPNCSTHTTYDEDEIDLPSHSTPEFFQVVVKTAHEGSQDYTFNWFISYGVLAIWAIVFAVSIRNVSFIGRLLRFTCLALLAMFFAVFIRLCFFEEAAMKDIFSYFVEPPLLSVQIAPILYMACWPLGSCMGNVLTMASFNNFRKDSNKLSYWTVGVQVLLTIMATICGQVAYDHFEDHVGLFHYHYHEDHSLVLIYFCYAYLFGSMNYANIWSFVFFSMLCLAETCGMIVQVRTVLTSLFDEFETLRNKKGRVTFGLIFLLLLISMFFCTKKGFEIGDHLPYVLVFSTAVISLLMVLVVTWIYGRKRFQCDLQFMLGKTISKFKIYLVVFATPFFIGIIIYQVWQYIGLYYIEMSIWEMLVHLLPFAAIPIYMIYKILHSYGAGGFGSFNYRERIQRLLAPQDWYPCDADNRRFYEEIMGISEMTVLDQSEI